MKIIYCHHAEREVDPKKPRSQDDNLTDNGMKDAELVSQLFEGEKITAIYTSNFYRCKKTAQIINRTLDVPIFEEPRFNEVGSVDGEEWKAYLQRNISALNDLQEKYNDEDTIICVTSGLNLSAFVCWNMNIKPNKEFPFIEAFTCAPVAFYMPGKFKFREKKFVRNNHSFPYRKNKEYKISTPTNGELKTYILHELKNMIIRMEKFTDKLWRDEFLSKLGELERSHDMGEIETKKYLTNRLSIDLMQLIKDYALINNIDYENVNSSTSLELNEEQCIKNMFTYVERLFYIDTNIEETLMLLYSTLVSYINYNDLPYDDIIKTCDLVEMNEGSYLNGKIIYKLR